MPWQLRLKSTNLNNAKSREKIGNRSRGQRQRKLLINASDDDDL
jgi:hypothetical protein